MITLLIAQKSQNEEVVPKPPHKPWQVCSTHTSPLTSTLSSSWYSLPVRGRNTGTLHLTPGIIMKTWDLPRVWRYWLARGALDTVTGFRRVHCCSPRNRSLTFIAVEKNIVWFPKDWKKKKKGGGIKERNSFFFFFFVLLSCFLSSCDWTPGLLFYEQEAAADASKGNWGELGFSFLSSSLYLSTPAGRVWGKKPPSSPPQLQCVRAENWRRSVWSSACQHHGDHTNVTVRAWLCVLRQENMLLPWSAFVHGKPNALFQKRLSDT